MLPPPRHGGLLSVYLLPLHPHAFALIICSGSRLSPTGAPVTALCLTTASLSDNACHMGTSGPAFGRPKSFKQMH